MSKMEEAKADYLAGMKYKDIAKKYGVALSTVKSWKTRNKWQRNNATKKKSMHTKVKSTRTKQEKVAPSLPPPELPDSDELNDKQKAFCLYYLQRYNATWAYQKAYGGSYNVATTNGPRLLGNARIKSYLTELKKQQSQELYATANDILLRYLNQATSNVVALMPQSFVNQATARCSVTGSKMWFNCNPEGPYHWFKLEWIDQMKDKRALRLHFMMQDNPSLAQETIDRYNRMYSGVFYQRYILGLWVMSEGVIYDNFDRDTMVVNELPNHFEKYYVSCDYGTQNPTVFLLWGRNHGIWYLVKEYYYSGRATAHQKTDEQYCQELKKFLGNIGAKIIIDPSAASFIAVLRNNGFRVQKAKNDVVDGIRVTQTAMNEGKILFSNQCPNLFKELSSYVWDEKAAERGEDKPVKEHDHACDAMRYFVYMVIHKGFTAKITKRPRVRGL